MDITQRIRKAINWLIFQDVAEVDELINLLRSEIEALKKTTAPRGEDATSAAVG